MVVPEQHKLAEEGDAVTRVNGLIHAFGESIRHFFRSQQRSAMTSPMFNLPGRLVLGSHCYYEQLPALLALLHARADGEAIAAGMKRLCARPNYVHLNSLALGFLVGREQARLTGRTGGDDLSGTCAVMDFWATVSRAYRNDGLLLPDEAAFTVPILDAEQVQALNGELRDDLPGDVRRGLRRMNATLELFTFILHGEARVGVFHHGPYPLDNGDVLLVRELVGLREEFYPWAQLDARLPYDNIATVMRLRGVRANIVLFGTLTTEPADYAPAIVAEQVFVVEDGAHRPLPQGDVARLTEVAAEAQLQLYRRVIDWDDRFRIEYGAELYAYLLKCFADPLGFGGEFGARVRSRFAQSVGRHLDDLHSGREKPLVLQHIAETDGPIFAPLDRSGSTGS